MQEKFQSNIEKDLELPKQLLLLHEEENLKLSRDVHSNLGQAITLLSMQLDRLRKLIPPDVGPVLDEIVIQKTELVQQIRDVSNYLSMYLLREVGLQQALSAFFNKVHSSTALNINFVCNNLESQSTSIVEMSIFRIIQEAIANVLKHANTDKVDISIETVENKLNLSIADRGAGFVSDSAKLNSAGMRGMRERAEILGASFKVVSSPGKGTTITAEFPLSS